MAVLFVLMQAILVITGAASMEELDESAVEQFDHYSKHPLRINCVSGARLSGSGLMSEYQAASLCEYRSRCGDVLSWAELAAVDGFGQRYADALREYVSLESRRRPGEAVRDSVPLSRGLTLRGMGRLTEDSSASFAAGGKYSLEAGDNFELALSVRNTYSDPAFEGFNLGAGVGLTGVLRRVIAGDYGLRFGQGLLVWSGFSMSGLNSAQALSRNGSGAYVSHSYTRMHHGAAAEFGCRGWTAVAAVSFPDFSSSAVPVVNIKRTGRTWNVSVTAIYDGIAGVSADFRQSFGRVSVFGEAAWCGAPAAVLGTVFVPRYGWTLTAQARHIPQNYASPLASPFSSTGRRNDEQGLSAALQTQSALFTLDASRRQGSAQGRVRALAGWRGRFSLAGASSIEPSLRASFLYRPDEKLRFKEDVRADCRLTSGSLWAAVRFNSLWCKDFSWMCYAEGGFGDRLSVSARACLFRVDSWDDRIYCYERDAPGNFNSLALYGRGWNASALVHWRMSRRHSLYLRAFGIFYPRMKDRKGYAELRLQYSLSLYGRTGRRFSARP